MKLIGDFYRLIHFLLRYSRGIKRSRVITISIIVTGVIGGLSVTALITLINRALSMVGSQSGIVIWGFVVLCVISPLTTFGSQFLLIRLTARSIFELRMKLCGQILSIPFRQLEELGAHRLLAALTQDIPTIITALVSLPMLCVNTTVIAGCLIYLGLLSWPLLLGVIGLLIFGIATFQIPMLKAVGYFRLARDEADTLFRQYRALADGAKELRLHKRRREAFYSWLGVTTRTLQRHTTVGNAIATAAANWGEILFFIFIGFLLFVLPSIIRIDNATLTAYVLTILFMRTPLAQLLNDIPNLGSATVATEKVETLGLSLLAQPLEESSTGEATSIRPWKHLGLVGVTHTYRHDGEDKDFVLGPINLSLYPGELVFLIGGNGSGKTTLAKILTGLYVPESGEVRFNDESVTIESRDLYRQYFSAVFTDFYLFETLLGLEGPAIDLKAHEYLVKLQLNHKVKVEDGALSTVDLSQGQRKRLALLTAYLEDRPIFLFDEWAADQDPLFKEVFYYSLLPELKARGKTVIVISHDDRYYHIADRIIKLNYGQLEYDRYVAQPEGLFSEKSQAFSQ